MIEFAGIAFHGLTLDDVFSERDGLAQIVTVNAEYIVRANEDECFGRIVNKGIAVFDGQVPYLVARWKYRHRHFDKISGSELVYHICERAARRGERVFLLGGFAESNARSVDRLRAQYPGLMIAGCSPTLRPYPFPHDHDQSILDWVGRYRPHYLLVGFGAVKQDLWINDHRRDLERMGVKLAIGVGGTFEMVSGKLNRAPRIVQRFGLEGVYRFAKEPKWFRLKRLLLSVRFLKYV
ncbi:MAG: WecB/TagA/CpsF family glycosyltransferase [Gammaproteobacteria bacterium]|nr:WecB/TagA/CpsF family glycosyltransferase [Gammaproteobacteria bacterium]